MLWRSLRGSRLDGLKFRRQVPVGNYVADFLCIEHRLIVELDGRPHENEHQRRHDTIRDEWLRDHGYHILRLDNDLVIGGGNIPLERIREVIKTIANRRGPSSDPTSSGHLLPQAGEGRTSRS
ncbi:endonuclease domain-containing protein [Methylosinus sp. Sm6]|uniref:endonuclease domain-containing protein n=1 Tax=Methylosinus sp. Sm6 TaxID=2866948 RepID=UPI00210619CE|nr:endonuclease domain-containing protein [Methylosinus sp. Sm6]